MLIPADADLVRREPGIPGLAILLDVEELVSTLRLIAPGAGIESAKARYIDYRPGKGCMVAYKLTISGAEYDAYIKAYVGDAREKLLKASRKSNWTQSPGFRSLALKEINAVLYIFPDDCKLKALKLLEFPEKRSGLLHNLFGEQYELDEGVLHQLRYKPEKRYVARLDVNGEPLALVKFFKSAAYRKAKQAARSFSSHGALQIASRLGYSDEHHALAFEWLAGVPLRKIILNRNMPEREKQAAVEMTGAALSELHMQKPSMLTQRNRGIKERLRDRAAAIIHICPEVEDNVGRLVNYIIEYLEDSPPTSVLHGDFYHQQVLCSDAVAAILDLDQARFGETVEDMGLFIAHLERDGLRGRLSQHDVESITNAFVEGYRGIGTVPSDASIQLYTAIGLLFLATEPFRFRKPKWPKKIKAILGHAETLLEKHSRLVAERISLSGQ